MINTNYSINIEEKEVFFDFTKLYINKYHLLYRMHPCHWIGENASRGIL